MSRAEMSALSFSSADSFMRRTKIKEKRAFVGSAETISLNGPGLQTISALSTAGEDVLWENTSTVGSLKGAAFLNTDMCNVHIVKFSPNNEYLAAGLASGHVLVFHVLSLKRLFKLGNPNSDLVVPVSSISWKPALLQLKQVCIAGSNEKTDEELKSLDVFLAVYPDGGVVQWHAPTGNLISRTTESDNQIFSVDYSPSSPLFATAGSDSKIRIYSSDSFEIIQTLQYGTLGTTTGHSNRIFCVKWHPRDSNYLISGGWDDTIQIWDRRAGVSVKSIFQPHVCGESIDFDDRGCQIIAGSHMNENCLTLYTLQGLSKKSDDDQSLVNYSVVMPLIENISWSILEEGKSSKLYVAFFSPKKKFIVAGGGAGTLRKCEVRLFLKSSKRCVGIASGFSGPVFTASMNKEETKLIVGGAFPFLAIYDTDASYTQEILY